MDDDLLDLSNATVFDERLREMPVDRDLMEWAVARAHDLLQEAR